MNISKTYEPQKVEDKIYRLWERGKYFTPKIKKGKKPFSILLPLPNANDPMHMGHALFTIEDILIRYHRMKGEPTLWLPGGDHAGIETQYVFEKRLAKEDKSRFDFDRQTLYQMIVDFVEKNKNTNKNQMKKLGFSLDWTRYHYSMEPKIQKDVFKTFANLYHDDLIYRAERMVNYCPKCGTAFSDLEINHEEKDDFLYYLNYGPISIATTRPETIFADVAVAVNPKDRRFTEIIGKTAIIPLIDKQIPIIADETIEIEFGTGALKVTPAHDPIDYEIGARHNLNIIKSVDLNGRMINVPEKYRGLKVNPARETVVADLKTEGYLIKTEPLKHTISTCYRCHSTIEPMLMPQWYVKTKPLAKPAIEAVKKGETKIVPKKRFEKMYFDWLTNILDWNISRQIVWGPRIPAWYCLDCNPDITISFINKNKEKVFGNYQELKDKYLLNEITNGLQSLSAPINASYSIVKGKCKKCKGGNIIQETDTFDTWFLSGQWPLNTLGFYDKNPDFKYFYPTSVLDTLWDILFFWVGRMMMLGIYATKRAPFKVIHLHARVVDKNGQKMSKSKSNVIDPIEMINKYGADALRMSLVYGVSPASDISVYDEKIKSMRNFANKVWNIGRFILSNFDGKKPLPFYSPDLKGQTKEDKKIVANLNKIILKTTGYLEKYRFDLAAEAIYRFMWHEFADKYIEYSKPRIAKGDTTSVIVLRHVYLNCLKLLHPFMPFITEELWQKFPKKKNDPLIISPWPVDKNFKS
ncbi:MAG: valine--tRNA ligase [bacterium]